MSTITHTSHRRTAAPQRLCAKRSGNAGYRYRRAPGSLRRSEAILLGLVLLLLVAAALASRPAQPGAVDTSSVRVAPGQTLWAIAQAHPVDGLSTAQTADLIEQLNDVEAATLQVGSVVRVPAQGSSDSALAAR